jgi:hypothetical protein
MRDDQFIITGFSLLDNEEYRHLMTKRKGIEMTYQWLRRNIVRGPMKNVYSNEVYNDYYLKGYLATSVGEEQLAEDLNLSRHCVRDNIKDLAGADVIKIRNLKSKSRGDGAQKKQKVYILGRWINKSDLNGREKYSEFVYIFDLITHRIERQFS